MLAHYRHPCVEDPVRWKHLYDLCMARYGKHCLHRNGPFGFKCDRTWGDRVPWTLFGKTEMNCAHIYAASKYPDKRWDENNVFPCCKYHNERNGTRTEIDPRPGHYVRSVEVLKWWLHLLLIAPFKVLAWVFTDGGRRKVARRW